MQPRSRPARHWVVGDVHGCAESLHRLVSLLPADDRLVLCGDVINRGPQIRRAMELAWDLVRSGRAVWLQGNHEADLVADLRRDDPQSLTRLAGCDTYRQLGGPLCRLWRRRLESLPSVYPGRGWVATHAGFDPHSWQPDLNIRAPFWHAYDGRYGQVVVGHTPGLSVRRHGAIVMVDTGACYGGELTAYCPETSALVRVPGPQPALPPALPPAMRAQLESLQAKPPLLGAPR
ncbi:metallophosphoesterase [Cyanobium sp. CH-040]|nr:metallophosphoesterase [Cyanobium sp. CH-040]MCP9927662.1 metallophosphoesterase [Cyanobium sp. CH-040]